MLIDGWNILAIVFLVGFQSTMTFEKNSQKLSLGIAKRMDSARITMVMIALLNMPTPTCIAQIR